MLLDQDQLSDAELWLDRLERVSNPEPTVALRAELLFRAITGAKCPISSTPTSTRRRPKHQGSARPRPPRRPASGRFWRPVDGATQKEQARTYFEKAREWYESYVQKRPGSEMLLAGFDARRGKVEEALQGIERYGEKSAPLDVVEVVGAIVSRPETTPAQLKTLESVVAALLDKTHRPTPLLIGLAEIQSAMDRPQDSEKIYREILRKDPRNDLACNNLSMILALQKTKLDEALELINKTIERAGPQGPFLDTRGRLIARREPQRALEDLELALAEKATPVRLFHKAWACLEPEIPRRPKNLAVGPEAGLKIPCFQGRNAKFAGKSPRVRN